MVSSIRPIPISVYDPFLTLAVHPLVSNKAGSDPRSQSLATVFIIIFVFPSPRPPSLYKEGGRGDGNTKIIIKTVASDCAQKKCTPGRVTSLGRPRSIYEILRAKLNAVSWLGNGQMTLKVATPNFKSWIRSNVWCKFDDSNPNPWRVIARTKLVFWVKMAKITSKVKVDDPHSQ